MLNKTDGELALVGKWPALYANIEGMRAN